MRAIQIQYDYLIDNGFERQEIYKLLVKKFGVRKTNKFVADIIREEREYTNLF